MIIREITSLTLGTSNFPSWWQSLRSTSVYLLFCVICSFSIAKINILFNVTWFLFLEFFMEQHRVFHWSAKSSIDKSNYFTVEFNNRERSLSIYKFLHIYLFSVLQLKYTRLVLNSLQNENSFFKKQSFNCDIMPLCSYIRNEFNNFKFHKIILL